jgi:hypothetical protein
MSELHRAGRSFAIVAGIALLTATVAASPSYGNAIPNPQKANQHKGGGQQAAAVLAQLHTAHALLLKADHDYSGHRAKAAHEVSEAIHAITGHKHVAGAGQNKGGLNVAGQNKGGLNAAGQNNGGLNAAGQNNVGAGKMPQAQSDAHLKQAAQILTQALSQMPAGHQATGKVQAAVTHIGTALKIK